MVALLAALNDCQVSKRGLEVYNNIPRAVEDIANFVGDVVDNWTGQWAPVKRQR